MRINLRRRLTLVFAAFAVVISGLVIQYTVGIVKPIVVQATNPPAAGWATVTSYNSSSSQDNKLTSVTCLTATNCMAAGYYCNGSSCGSSKYQTLIESYNGTSWSTMSAANAGSGQNNFLKGITCVASNDCWAVGYYCSTTGTCPRDKGPYWQTLIEHYNGSAWSVTSSPNKSTSQDNVLNGVTCAASNLCWAVGSYCERSDTNMCTYGSTHSTQPLIEKWNGTSWALATEATNSTSKNHTLTGVTCTSTTNCWASGYYCNSTAESCPRNNGPYNQTLIEKWDGTSWTVATSPNTSTSKENVLNAVACSSASACWAVGYACATTSSCGGGSGANNQTLIQQWDGSSWTTVSSPNPSANEDNELNAVTCVGANDCIAVGYWCNLTSHICDDSTYDSNQTLAQHWDGTSWYRASSSNVASVSNYLNGVACVAGAAPDDCMAVGYQSGSKYQTLTGEYGGPVQAAPASSAWSAASGIGNSSTSAPVAPSGIEGDVNLTNGAAYLNASDISIPGRGPGLNVSRSYNGPQKTADEDNIILETSCVSTSNCWSVGYYCTGSGGEACANSSNAQTLIQHYDGSSWITVPSPNNSTTADNILNGVNCVSASDCWAVGHYDNGTVWQAFSEHYDGTKWSVVAMASTGSTHNDKPNGVQCVSTSDCWSVGYWVVDYERTFTEHYDGTSWSVVSSPNTSATEHNHLYRVSCTSTSNCWAVGHYAAPASTGHTLSVHYTSGAWSIVYPANTSASYTNILYHVWCVTSSNCWAVGKAANAGGYWQTLIEQYNGTSWSIKTSWNSSSTQNNDLNWVFCRNANLCYASDNFNNGTYEQTLVEKWDGTSWSHETTPNTSTTQENRAKSVTCASDTDCWLTGFYSISGEGGFHLPLVAHLVSGTWTIPTDDNLNAGGTRGVFASGATDGPFGYGWTSNIGMKLTAGSGTETITDETGTPVTFSGSGSSWTAPGYNASTLTVSGSSWTYTRWNGDTFVFDSSHSGRLTSEADRNGNTTSYTYSGTSPYPLSTITSAGGQSVSVTWNSAKTHITQLTDPASQTVGYAYDNAGDLTQVTDQAGNHINYVYDANHDLLSATDATGTNATTYSYSVTGQVVTETDPLSHPTDYDYTTPASPVVTRPEGDKTQYTYQYGLLTNKVAAYGKSYAATTTYLYDPATLGVYQQIDPLSTTTFNTYDTNASLLTATVDPVVGLTTTTSATYNSLNEPLTQTDANGVVSTNKYDSSGNLCWTLVGTSANACNSRPTGATAYLYADGSNPGLATTVTDENGNSTVNTYDSYGNELSATDANSSKTSHTYNSLNEVATDVPPKGNVGGCDSTCKAAKTTTFSYNLVGDRTSSTGPNPTGGAMSPLSQSYDKTHDVLTTTDPATNLITNKFDANRAQCWAVVGTSSSACTSPPSGGVGATYDGDGRIETSTDANGTVTTYTYNDLGQKIVEEQTTPSNGPKTTYTYDANGNMLTMISPDGNVPGCSCASTYTTTKTYDGYGHLLTTTLNGHTTTNTYDPIGNVLTVTDGAGNVTTTTYDSHNRVCWTLQGTSGSACGSPPSGSVAETYDSAGNVLTVTDGNSNVTTNAYDAGNRICWTYRGSSGNACGSPPSTSTSYMYDANGNVLTTTKPDGTVITSAYNEADKACWTYVGTSSNACGSPPGGATAYTYDADGHRLTMVDSTGTSTWVYDAHGWVTSYTNGAGAVVAYNTRDSNGNPTKITYPSGLVVSQAFNTANRMCWTYVGTSTNACGSPPGGANVFAYDASGNLTSETLANGVVNTYTVDATGATTAISDVKGGTTIFSASYARNGANQVTSDNSQPNTVDHYRYTTDKKQLCYADSATSTACGGGPPPFGTYAYSYDNAGNVTYSNGTTQTYDSKSELCWSVAGTSGNACGSPPGGAATYGYSTNGNRTSKVPSAGSATCYTYDSFDRLTAVKTGTGSSCTTPTTVGTYTYDGDGMRMSKVVGGTTTAFSWSGGTGMSTLLEEKAGSNTTSYVYGPTGMPLEEILPGGTTYYYSHDSIGSTRALTDSSGISQATDTYDPYGNLAASTGSLANNLLYTGQYLDSESGLYYLRARYYDPVTAQFLTVDPMVAQTMQPYAYAAGDPVDAVDPTGLVRLQDEAKWAENNATVDDSNGYSYFLDCADFVSRAMVKGGGDSMRWGSTDPADDWARTSDDAAWFNHGTFLWTHRGYSNSWSLAPALFDHLVKYRHSRVLIWGAPLRSNYSWWGFQRGDLIFAKWNDSNPGNIGDWGNIDHVGVLLDSYGSTCNPRIAQHSNNAIRTFNYWLQQKPQTHVWIVRPSP